MARIRSIKPEFWTDRKLARVTRDARLLYISLWNLADEWCRVHGDTRFVKGHCLPYDDDLTLRDVDRLLGELESAGHVQQYDSGGDPYLYLPKLAKHQRLEPHKVPSRLPEPPEQGAEKSASRAEKSAPDANDSEPIVALQVAGSRLQVAGSKVQVEPPSGAQTIVAAWIDSCRKRPPQPVVGQVAKLTANMLSEGIDPADVRRGLDLWSAKGLHPSALPSVVNEAMNARPMARQSTTDAAVQQTLELAALLRQQEGA